MAHNDDVINRMLEQFDKYEDCNTSFNSTMDIVVEEAKKSVVLNDEVLEFLWERIGEILVNDDGEIEDEFMGYEEGTNREDIWSWFDENYSKGVYFLSCPEQAIEIMKEMAK